MCEISRTASGHDQNMPALLKCRMLLEAVRDNLICMVQKRLRDLPHHISERSRKETTPVEVLSS